MNVGLSIPIKDCIIEKYDDVLEDILAHGHTHYVGAGGRGSTKSSFFGGIAIVLLIMLYKNVHALCFRKVGNTIQNSIYAQVVWAIYKLGVDSLFHIPKTYSTPIVYKPTGQRIMFMGLDDPNKVKSVKIPFLINVRFVPKFPSSSMSIDPHSPGIVESSTADTNGLAI